MRDHCAKTTPACSTRDLVAKMLAPVVLVLAPAVAAFVAPPLLAPSSPIQLAPLTQSRGGTPPRMGFLDDIKQAFENDPKLEQARKKENKKVSAKTKAKMKDREQYERRIAAQKRQAAPGEIKTGNNRMDEILSSWTWK